jgi:glycosyltransferase involved in cell wall biosynthesis
VVYFWNLNGLTSLLVHTAQALGLKTSFFVSDEWLLRWTASDRWLRWGSAVSAQGKFAWLKPILRLVAAVVALPTDQPELRNVQFASGYLREATVAGPLTISQAEVIHWGVDLDVFRFCPKTPEAVRLLHVGQVAHHKGVDTAIEALHWLRQTAGGTKADLTIAGGTVDSKYEAYLRALVRERRLDDAVHFVGVQTRSAMVELIAQSDIFVFPYRWREGLSITVLEAMSMGTVVVGTATGGNAEVLRDGENALVFPVDDSQALAACLRRLSADGELFRRLQAQARLTVEQNHNIEHMVSRIEQSLRKMLAGTAGDMEHTAGPE